MNFVPYFITTLFFLPDYTKKEQSLKIQFNLTFNTYLIIKIVPHIAVARCATYCLQTHPIGDLPGGGMDWPTALGFSIFYHWV
jgi:hypothetical protein